MNSIATLTPAEVDIPIQDVERIIDLLKTNNGLIEFAILAALVGFFMYLKYRNKE